MPRGRLKISTGGPWGTGFLCLGLAVTAVGVSYITAKPGDLSPALAGLSGIVPPWAWGLLWIGVGIFSMTVALQPPQRPTAILPMVGIFTVWAVAHAYFWLYHGIADGDWASRGWSSAVGWGMLAVVVACWGRCVNPPTSVHIP